MESEKIIDHVWKYFEIHSQQRMTLFNFFIVVVGGIASAIGFCLQSEKDLAFIIYSLIVVLLTISFLFYKLDQRTAFLIKRCEKNLVKLESQFTNSSVDLFTNDDLDLAQENKNRFFNKIWTYGDIFRLTYTVIGLVSIFCLILGFYNG